MSSYAWDDGTVVVMEDQQFERYIVQQSSWDSLPLDVRKRLGNSKDTWRQNVCRYSIRHQLRWKTNLVKSFIPDEKAYYTEVLRFSRVQYMVRSLVAFRALCVSLHTASRVLTSVVGLYVQKWLISICRIRSFSMRLLWTWRASISCIRIILVMY